MTNQWRWPNHPRDKDGVDIVLASAANGMTIDTTGGGGEENENDDNGGGEENNNDDAGGRRITADEDGKLAKTITRQCKQYEFGKAVNTTSTKDNGKDYHCQKSLQ